MTTLQSDSDRPTDWDEAFQEHQRQHPDFIETYIPSSPYASFLLEAYTAELAFCHTPPSIYNLRYLKSFRELLRHICDDDEFPPVLRQVTIDYLLFFAREWLPYLQKLDQTARGDDQLTDVKDGVDSIPGRPNQSVLSDSSAESDVASRTLAGSEYPTPPDTAGEYPGYLALLRAKTRAVEPRQYFEWYRRPGGRSHRFDYANVALWYTKRLGSPIYQRWKQRLLRAAQIRLLEIAMGMIIDQMKTLMQQQSGLDEMQLALQNGTNLVTELVGDRAFRSERLERCLLAYLAEEDVQEEIARGVEEKTLEYRRWGYGLFCELEERWPGEYERKVEVADRTVVRQIGFVWYLHAPVLFTDR